MANIFLREKVGPFWAKRLHKDSDLMVIDNPLVDGAVYAKDESKMAATAIISTPVFDRDGDIVDQLGIQLDEYRGNPVVFFQHRQWPLPVGKSQDPDGLITVFPTEEKTEATCYFSQKSGEAYQVYDLVAENILRATSIGFNLLEALPLAEGRYHIKRLKLTEWSWCGLGANQEALLVRLEKGYIRNEPIGEQLRKALDPIVAELRGRPLAVSPGGIIAPVEKTVEPSMAEPSKVEPVEAPTAEPIKKSLLGPLGKMFGATDARITPWRAKEKAKTQKVYAIPEEVRKEAAMGLYWAKSIKTIPQAVRVRGLLLVTEKTVAESYLDAIIKRAGPALEIAKSLPGWKTEPGNIPNPGRVAWALWGGDSALSWAKAIKEGKDMADNNVSSGMGEDEVIPPGQAVVDAVKQLLEAAINAQEQPELTAWIQGAYHSLADLCGKVYPDAGFEFSAIEKLEEADPEEEVEEDGEDEEEVEDPSELEEEGDKESEDEEEDEESDEEKAKRNADGEFDRGGDDDEGEDDEEDEDKPKKSSESDMEKRMNSLQELFGNIAQELKRARGQVD